MARSDEQAKGGAQRDAFGRPDATRGPDLHYGHPRMALSDRAKIFIPFNPLRGFTEALRAEEERHEREVGERH